MSAGLFLVRLERICITRRISRSLPITGSICPRAAASVKSRPYWSKVFVSVFRCTGRGILPERGLYSRLSNTQIMSVYSLFRSMPKSVSACAPEESVSRRIPIRMCSVPTKQCPNRFASSAAKRITRRARGDKPCAGTPGLPFPAFCSTADRIFSGIRPWSRRIFAPRPSCSAAMPMSRCSVPT